MVAATWAVPTQRTRWKHRSLPAARGAATVFALAMLAAPIGCGGGAVNGGGSPDAGLPSRCGADTCNQTNGGGTCDDSSGQVTCACVSPYLGGSCRDCAAGYHPAGGDLCEADAHPACTPAAGGSSGAVQTPVLRMTLPASWDENWLASPAVVDLNGDGKMEIVAARHSVLYAWSADGKMLWRAAFGHNASDPNDHGVSRMWASPAIGDFNGDGKMEIAVGSDADSSLGENVAVYDHNGELLPGWPQHFGGTDEVRSITAGDLDGDGKMEIVVNKTNKGPATAVYELDGTLRSGWPEVNHSICDPPPPAEACWDFGGYNQNIGLADMDGDGRLDVITTYDAIGFGIFHDDGTPFKTAPAFTDRVVTAVEAYNKLAFAEQGWGNGSRSEFTYSPPALADVNGDGTENVVLVGDHESTQSTTNQGVTFWVLNPDATRPTGWVSPKNSGAPLAYGDLGNNIVTTMPSPSVANIDGDPGLEILAPAYDGKLYAYNADGTVKWTYTFDPSASPYIGASEAVIADLNGDGVPEIIFNTYTTGTSDKPATTPHLIILNNNGVKLQSVPLYGRGSMAAPTVADIYGDGKLEIVVSLKDTLGGGKGGVQIWNVPGSSDNCMPWPTGRGDYLRQGVPSVQ